MNLELIKFERFVCFLFCIPAILIYIKMLIHLVCKIKYEIICHNYTKMRIFLRASCPACTFDQAAEKLNVKERYEYLLNYKPKVSNFIDTNLTISDWNVVYNIFAVVSQAIAIFATFGMALNEGTFREQERIYDSGNFTCIAKYYNYEEIPQWNNDKYAVCLAAEDVNSEFFTEENSLKYEDFKYILKEELDKVQPVNTNQMWREFFETETDEDPE